MARTRHYSEEYSILCSFFPSEAATSGLTSKPAAKSTELRFTIAMDISVAEIKLVVDDVRSSESFHSD
jgi:hypothetical protein